MMKKSLLRPLGRPKCWWGNNIKMGLRETRCGGTERLDLAQDSDR
jgi:hypothetical protein